jgi:hypothetical protein
MSLLIIDKDTAQHDTFFMGHPAVISPWDVLGILIRHFNEASLCAKDVCEDIRMRLGYHFLALCNSLILMISVMCFIKNWLENENIIIGNSVLAEMHRLADAIDSLDDLNARALEVLHLIPDKVFSLLSTRLHSHKYW